MKIRRPNYLWFIDLYERLNLPVVPAVVQALHKATAERIANLEKHKTEKGKQRRIHMKVVRAEDQEARKKWGKQQAVQHTYGQESEGEDDDDENLVRNVAQLLEDEESITVVSGRKCRCGATSHSRISHHSCPLNKRNN